MTDVPVAIFHYDGKQVVVLSANQAFRQIIRQALPAYNEKDLPLRIENLSFRQRLQPCLDELIASGQEQVVTYIEEDHYLQLHLGLIGGTQGRYLCRAWIYNIADARENKEAHRIDYLLRNILQLYKRLYYLNPQDDTFEVIKTVMPNWAKGQVQKGILRLLTDYTTRFVHDDDRKRFLAFLDFDNVRRQAGKSQTNSTGSVFRIKQADGSYRWTVYSAMLLRNGGQQGVLLCCCDDIWETARDRKSLLPILATSLGLHELEPVRQPYFRILRELCQAMIRYSDIKFFWKDRKRRFAGVSQAFLDYYGLKDEKSLIGKTDEDIGWHIQGKKYEEAEWAVLEKGEVTHCVVGECLVQGRPHRIAATQFPIYRGRRIIGLLGYFPRSHGQRGHCHRHARSQSGCRFAENVGKIGHSLQAERVLIFEEQGNQVSATYEWHQENLQPVARTVQHIPINSLRPLYDTFDTKQMAIIEDAPEFIRTHPGFHPYIPGCRRLVSGHLTQSGKSLGFTEVINPSALAFKSAGLLLSTLTLFLAIMLRNRDIFRSLERISTTDQLTGVGNRRGFAEYRQTLPDGISLAFIFGNLNGLKKINDTQGHEVGDQLIRQAAQIMKNLTGDIAVFRMGGDEFIIVAKDADEAQAQRLVNDLRARYRSSGISMALGYIVCQTPIANIVDVLSQVDKKMYADKERIYGRRHP